jgi:hypothetical protein
MVILLLFTSLNTETRTMTESNPSLSTYMNLESLYSNTLICPCSNMVIPYQTFVSMSATFHQVCSSDFISNSWILVLQNVVYDAVSDNPQSGKKLLISLFLIIIFLFCFF